jgi:hypothetical protein
VIIDDILSIVSALLRGFFDLLPSWTLPSWLAAGTAFPSGVAATIGGYLRVVAPFLPVDVCLTVIGSILSLWLAIVGFLVFQWVWEHVPTIAGFGTGDG